MGTKQFDNYADLITFTRASGATYLDSDGVLKTASTNIPRIEYDADGNRLGLLVEEQRTNLLTYSEDFSQWTGFSDTNQIVAPDGTLTATKARDNNEGTNAPVTLNESVTVNTSTTYTYSVFGKKGQLNWMALGIINFTTPSNGRVWFDLDSGVVGTQNSGLSGAIEEFSNGWYRCSVTFTTDASDTSGQLYIYLCEGDNQFINTNRDGTSDLYVWGAQLEAGAFPTSYIPTSGSTATRAADVASIPTSAFGYNASEGTAFCEFSLPASWVGSGFPNAIMFYKDGPNRFGLTTSLNSDDFRFNGLTSSVSQFDLLKTTNSAGQTQKHIFGFKNNSFAYVVDGDTPSVDSSGTLPDIPEIIIGNSPPSAYLNGHIKSIKYYPRRLTNAQLQELTQ